MNAVRAPSFKHSARTALIQDASWPKLPPGFQLERVSGVAVDSRSFVYVGHRGDTPLLCFHPDGHLERKVRAGVHLKCNAYDLREAVPVTMEVRHWLH